MKIHFDDADMDAQLSRTLVAVSAGACDLGEALATAGRVTEGDYDSWYQQWSQTAEVAQYVADTAARGGHTVTARQAYFRASEYWRQAFFFIRRDLAGERLQRAWRQHRAAFRSALPFLETAVVTAEIPFENHAMIDADPQTGAALEGLRAGPRNAEWYGARMATMGAATVGDLIRRQIAFDLSGCVGQIRCPTLITEGEGDFAAQGQALYDSLAGGVPKKLKRFREAEGAGGHCEGLGATLFEGYVFDWLDDIFSGS